MAEIPEKRGPIEKGKQGWPINPFGVIALLLFAAVVVFFIIRPIASQKLPVQDSGAEIVAPKAGEIVKGETLVIQLSVKESDQVEKVQFWTKTYVDGKWQMIADDDSPPFQIEWSIPASYQNKAIAITSHLYLKDGQIIKDPGGWREGIIVLSEK